MEPHTILLYLGCVPSVIAICISVMLIHRKQRAREVLLRKLVNNSDFLSEIEHLRDAQVSGKRAMREEHERITALILKQLKELDDSDQLRIETGLYQSSSVGRERYLDQLVKDAELQRGALSEARAVMVGSE